MSAPELHRASTIPLGPRAERRAVPSRGRRALTALRARLFAIPPPLALLLVLGTVQALAWSVATAPLQGPDESAHVAYAQYLAETGSPPVKTGGSGHVTSTAEYTAQRWYQLLPLVGDAAARPAWSPADRAQYRKLVAALPPGSRADGDGPNAVAQNPPLYYALEAVPYELARLAGGGFLSQVWAMRLLSVCFYLATIAAAWALAGEIFRRAWKRTLATAIVALLPQLAFMGAIVNPDILLACEWTWFLAVAARLVRRGFTLRRVAALGLLCAASALTHGRGLPLFVPGAAALGLAAWRHRPGWRVGGRMLAVGAAPVAVAIAAALVVTSASSGGAFGGQVGLAADTSQTGASITGFLSYLWQFYLPPLAGMAPPPGPRYGFDQVFIRTFVGTFGSLEVQLPNAVYALLHVLVLLGLAGLLTAVVARWEVVRERWPVVALLAFTTLVLLGTLHVIAYRDLTGSGDPLLVGRYLLPLVGVFAAAVTFTIGSLPRRLAYVGAGGIVALGVILQLAGLGLSFTRFYA